MRSAPILKLKLAVLLAILIFPFITFSAEVELDPQAAAQSAEWFWNLVISLIVITISAASAALPVAAFKQWTGSWRIAAMAPLVVLLLWVTIIVIARLESIDAHRLWPFEIFAWAMLNMIYMVAVMTIKRVLDKADEEESLSN